MKKLINKKGFTLAELLIVVAIIAVLVAIAIPVFSSQLEKSRDSVTVSNLRAAYAQAQAAYLTGSNDGTDVVYDKSTKKVTVSNVKAKGTQDTYNGLDSELPFSAPASMDDTPGTYTVTFDYSGDKLNISSVSAVKTGA